MFKSGVHFGHSKSRKNPRMDEYIYAVRKNISIIDLQKTVEKLKEAMAFLSEKAAAGEEILFVGTKKQAKDLVEAAAKACKEPYVKERWLGGTFTNFKVLSERARFLREGQEKMEKGEFAKYTKFEKMKIAQELERLEKKMGGIKEMRKLPGAVFVAGTIEDALAIKEAEIKGVPVVALVDSNADLRGVDYPIPSNDDAVSSLKIMLSYIVKAVLEGKSKMKIVADKKTNDSELKDKQQ
ncbi:MAG: 30S ribosomal protein S2 [Candidatus Moranbacteria bacterium RIFOXYA12_FULL_44_15]|nr:MAG: 30S ribosomal protein S2 [Candidatus Moranbacteria bacterium RIFOXYA12_FULL_44_15]OGI35595.1 MAG: 30S ribosomal protein S2 [Candidatus Moranbacteria bacterium RIFOXYA2_FULL_43_15]